MPGELDMLGWLHDLLPLQQPRELPGTNEPFSDHDRSHR